MENKLITLLADQQDITWKSIIYDLIRTEQMDPWNVDISLLANKYIQRIKEYSDLKVGGNVLLAAALLLKIKSSRLVGEDLNEFDRLLAQQDLNEEEFYDDLETGTLTEEQKKTLIPRTPQPRKRKVSVYDLVKALEKALEVKHRRLVKKTSREYKLYIPQKPVDIHLAIKQLYKRILDHYISKKTDKMTFKDLAGHDKTTKIHTFIPLLHLSNHRKIDLHQEQPFDNFTVQLARK
jgi:segregation and condensation protein A